MQQPIRGEDAGDEVCILADYNDPASIIIRSEVDQIRDEGSIDHFLAGRACRVILKGERQVMISSALSLAAKAFVSGT